MKGEGTAQWGRLEDKKCCMQQKRCICSMSHVTVQIPGSIRCALMGRARREASALPGPAGLESRCSKSAVTESGQKEGSVLTPGAGMNGSSKELPSEL
jgi:hypothetical protein